MCYSPVYLMITWKGVVGRLLTKVPEGWLYAQALKSNSVLSTQCQSLWPDNCRDKPIQSPMRKSLNWETNVAESCSCNNYYSYLQIYSLPHHIFTVRYCFFRFVEDIWQFWNNMGTNSDLVNIWYLQLIHKNFWWIICISMISEERLRKLIHF